MQRLAQQPPPSPRRRLVKPAFLAEPDFPVRLDFLVELDFLAELAR